MNTIFSQFVRLNFLIAFLLLSRLALADTFEFLALPGSGELPADIQAEIAAVWNNVPANYDPRTKHLDNFGKPIFVNRLFLELSPYLRQHAHNPVNWQAWSDEAFAEAKARNVPIFLSVGYSSCHWCHVMEEESFDAISIAELLNENYVAIKVDRETNPDVDELFQLAVEAMGSFGGWPLNVFMTPDGKPFFGMTYAPIEELEVLLFRGSLSWNAQQDQIQAIADQVSEIVSQFGTELDEIAEIEQDLFLTVVKQIRQEQLERDEFSVPANNFPVESELLFLLDTAVRHQNEDALKAALHRLNAMAAGGIRDHIGGGFHRYAVDNEWLIPHFEKMLYNQALISRAYLHAFEITGSAMYQRVAKQALEYVLREMTGPDGNFLSATDADSGGFEGEFFVWSPNEIQAAVGADAEFVIEHYSVTQGGNFEGKNVLNQVVAPELKAQELGINAADYLHKLENARQKMLDYRNHRERPFLDHKSITAWNGMMITTLAEASRILHNETYLDAAMKAANFIWHHKFEVEGRLFRIYIDGAVMESGKLRDYAYFIQAMLSIYDRTQEKIWLDRSEQLTEQMIELFWDHDSGGFFSVADDDVGALFARHKDRFDEMMPSGNAVAALGLARLYHRTGKQIYANQGQKIFNSFAAEIVNYPVSFAYMLAAREELQNGSIGPREFVASGNGVVSVTAKTKDSDGIELLIELNLDDGWHVQSNSPLDPRLFATDVSVVSQDWKLAAVDFPAAKMLHTSFQVEPLSVWSQRVVIPVSLQKTGGSNWLPKLEVELQACSDELCLLPETVSLELSNQLITGLDEPSHHQ